MIGQAQRRELPHQSSIDWLFLVMAMVSSFSCMLRPDYNFAFALLSYYALKRSTESKTLHLVIYLNAALFVFDIVWCATMGSVWSGKPAHDEAIWEAFNFLHSFVIGMSVVNIIIRAVIEILLFVAISQSGGLKGPKEIERDFEAEGGAYDMGSIHNNS